MPPYGSVVDVLKNPKYTGYQVFNRRATTSKRGKVNEPFKWAWSPKPIHEPLIPQVDVRRTHQPSDRQAGVSGRRRAQHKPEYRTDVRLPRHGLPQLRKTHGR
ncbi:recombinase family protein [Amycolatopsis speibonae]|uniref:Recombinase family protein n=1 Tax=Amycolatopsis speibonae TaxID=1450224 RepID=A0ABV7NT74_9PSEU